MRDVDEMTEGELKVYPRLMGSLSIITQYAMSFRKTDKPTTQDAAQLIASIDRLRRYALLYCKTRGFNLTSQQIADMREAIEAFAKVLGDPNPKG